MTRRKGKGKKSMAPTTRANPLRYKAQEKKKRAPERKKKKKKKKEKGVANSLVPSFDEERKKDDADFTSCKSQEPKRREGKPAKRKGGEGGPSLLPSRRAEKKSSIALPIGSRVVKRGKSHKERRPPPLPAGKRRAARARRSLCCKGKV